MLVGGGVQMLRKQYLAGFKEDRAASYPTVRRLDVQANACVDGTIDDVYKEHPELETCLYNDVKTCTSCGKPNAYTMVVCNSCGKDLPTVISKSENVFSAFLLGVKLASKGFPYTISLRRETDDVLVFDDMLQLSPCHLNGVSKKYYIPDWRYLLPCPRKSLELLDTMEKELWDATLVFLQNPEFRSKIYRGAVTDEDIRKGIAVSFNFPPSQFQLHIQWIVPPMMPFQHQMAEQKNHYHQGRAFPMSYVRAVLALDSPYEVTKNTPIEEIIEYYKGLGVDYNTAWTTWYESIGLGSTLGMQNWNPDDFQYVVQDGKLHNFNVVGDKVELGGEIPDLDPSAIQAKDKVLLQNYGRPYNEAGKPSGTYIQKALEPKFGEGGYWKWPPGGTSLVTSAVVHPEGQCCGGNRGCCVT